MVIPSASQPLLYLSDSRPSATAVSVTGTVADVVVATIVPVRITWVAQTRTPPRTPTPPPWKAEVANKDDVVEVIEMVEAIKSVKSIVSNEPTIIETVETTEPINSVEVSIAKTIHHRTAVHWHPSHRMWRETAAHSHASHRATVTSHLRRRSRGCENTCCYATKVNDSFQVHDFVPFQKIEPAGI